MGGARRGRKKSSYLLSPLALAPPQLPPGKIFWALYYAKVSVAYLGFNAH